MTIKSKRRELARLRSRLPPARDPIRWALCRSVAAEQGIDPEELWAEAEKVRAEVRGLTKAQAEARLLAIINAAPPRPVGLEA